MSKKNGVCAEIESESRRKAVKTLVGGVTAVAAYNALPAKWGTPIIEQIFLPAHAQTSGAICNGCNLKDPCLITLISGSPTSSEVVVQVVGSVQPPTPGLPATITVTPVGAGVAPPVFSATTDAQGEFRNTFTITGGPGITAVSAVTRVEGVASAVCDISTTTPNQPPTTTSAPTTTSTTPAPTTTTAPATVTVINNSTPVISFRFIRNSDGVLVNVGLNTTNQSVVDVLVGSNISITNNGTETVSITGPGTNTTISGGSDFQYTISDTTAVVFTIADIIP